MYAWMRLCLYVLGTGLALVLGKSRAMADTPPVLPMEDFRQWCEEKSSRYDWISEKGIVTVRCTITSSGDLVRPEIVHSLDSSLHEAAFMLLEEMPRWTPATRDGKAVDAECVLPLYIGKEEEYFVTEILPVFPEGKVDHWLNRRAAQYARRQGVKGRVYLSYVIEADGHPSRAEVVRCNAPASRDSLKISEAALQFIRQMPPWIPGRVKGRPVATHMTSRIDFQSPAREDSTAAVDRPPCFPWGEAGEWVENHLFYPLQAYEDSLPGHVELKFRISRDGKVLAPRVVSGSHRSFAEAALPTVAGLPDWIPAVRGDRTCETQQTLSISFSPDRAILREADEAPRFTEGNIREWVSRQANPPFSYLFPPPQGRTVFRFIIEKDGSISHPEILESSGDALLDADAARIIRRLPTWIPAKHKGRPVRTAYILPVEFAPSGASHFRICDERLPVFLQGDVKEWLRNHVIYPQEAYEADLQTFDAWPVRRIYVSFHIGKDGSVSQPEVIRGSGQAFRSAALQAIRSMPRWQPASRQGEAVESVYTLPVTFDMNDPLFLIADTMPAFRGNLQEWLREKTRQPLYASSGRIVKIFVQFIIEKDGSVSHVEVVRGETPEVNNMTVRIIQSMPPWRPGKHRGRAVRILYTLPVVYLPY